MVLKWWSGEWSSEAKKHRRDADGFILFLEWKEGQIPHHIVRLTSKKIRIPKETKAEDSFYSTKKSHSKQQNM